MMMRWILVCAALVTAAFPAGATAERPLDRPSDATVAEWVREALAADPRVDSGGVAVAVANGIATLRGSVPTLAGKRFTILTSQRIFGVLGVVDQVEVEAAVRPDAEIARDVSRRIEWSQSVSGREIEVSSKAATVRLDGAVQSWSQRLEAELLAAEVRGVRAIDNQLMPRIEPTRSDREIQSDVAAALRRDAYLVGLPIEAAVVNGRVQLSGIVSSPYERTRAATQAGRVSNVRGVDNLLAVEWWPDRSTRVAPPVPRSDEDLEAIVRDELVQDDRIDASGIAVTSSKGHVTLSGTVPSAGQRRLAAEDARAVVAVAWITNHLRVDFTKRPDEEVKRELEQILASDSVLSESEITIAVEDGVVTLVGDVDSGYHRAHAAAIASRVRGVHDVVNQLQSTAVQRAADAALALEIARRLKRDWRTGPVSDRIDVGVEIGVVTLVGDVDRLAERRAARRIASRTPGVRYVHNRLRVDPFPYPWDDPAEDDDAVPDSWYWDLPELPWIAWVGRLPGFGPIRGDRVSGG